jgi:hypothetical protein
LTYALLVLGLLTPGCQIGYFDLTWTITAVIN